MKHIVNSRSWPDPHLGRRAEAACTCDWTTKGLATDVAEDVRQHIATTKTREAKAAVHNNPRLSPVDSHCRPDRAPDLINTQPNKEKS